MQKTGLQGHFFQDVFNGGGDGEYFFTECDGILGNYLIAVNYYEGVGPSEGYIEVKVG